MPRKGPVGRPSRAAVVLKRIITCLISVYGGNVTRLASDLGVRRQQIYDWRDRTPLRPRIKTIKMITELAERHRIIPRRRV